MQGVLEASSHRLLSGLRLRRAQASRCHRHPPSSLVLHYWVLRRALQCYQIRNTAPSLIVRRPRSPYKFRATSAPHHWRRMGQASLSVQRTRRTSRCRRRNHCRTRRPFRRASLLCNRPTRVITNSVQTYLVDYLQSRCWGAVSIAPDLPCCPIAAISLGPCRTCLAA